MFSEKTTVTKIEVEAESGTVFVRSVKRILKDGEVFAESLWSDTLYPGDDLTQQDAKVTAIAHAVWTTEILEKYQASLQTA